MKLMKLTIHPNLRTLRLHVLGGRVGAVTRMKLRTANASAQVKIEVSAIPWGQAEMKRVRVSRDEFALFLAAAGQPKNSQEGAVAHASSLVPEFCEWLERFNAGGSKGDVGESIGSGLGNKIGSANPSKFRHLLNRFRDAVPGFLRIRIFGFGVTHKGMPMKCERSKVKMRTANETEMRLSAAICTANIAGVADGEWGLISPYGDHASPDGSYTQRFSREQAEKVVKTWNSITGTAARAFKNVMHGLGAKFTTPVWEGHPETDKQRWPKEKLLAEITDVRTGNEGLEGRVSWNARGAEKRAAGALYPSPLWWHWPPSGEPPTVFPELLESVGLVATPNIASVPAWTQNASPNLGVSDPFLKNQKPTNTPNTVDRNKLIKMLGLAAEATDEQIDATLKGVETTANALQTANAAQAGLETQLATANTALSAETGKVTALTGERDQFQTANAELITANGVLVKGVLDMAEKRGAVTPAERAAFEARIATANTAAAALTELQTRKAMNTQSVEINGNRIDLTTANARAEALEGAIAQKMKDTGVTREEAFAKCQADPNLTGLFGAMADPTRTKE